MSHHSMAVDVDQITLLQDQMNYSEADYAAAEADFLRRYPAYRRTALLDDLRQSDYERLDRLGHIYLDYTGGGLYAESQVKAHNDLLLNGVYGNPHSANPTSLAMTQLDEQAREYIYQFFNADPDEYVVIFTPNATGAMRLVGEAYPFDKNGQYLLTFDNHNSANGIREFARRANAPITYMSVLPPDMRIDETTLLKHLDQAIPGGNNLFAYPAQSNFSGVQHSLQWIDVAHEKGWDVLLDSAAFVPTNCLDLSRVKPDFVPLSFYKMFGYPTGLGALIARRSAMSKLCRPWFAGGTITVASVQGDHHYLEEGPAAFEDGTIDYLNIPAVEIGLRHLQKIGIDLIHERVVALTGYLLDELTALRHDSGNTLVTVYGPVTTEARGGTIAMNFFDPDHTIFDFRLIEALANTVHISLRTGCFCNPGAGELALNIPKDVLMECFEDSDRMTYEQFAMAIMSTGRGEGVGAVRISPGLATNFRDVYHLVRFASSFLNRHSEGMVFDNLDSRC